MHSPEGNERSASDDSDGGLRALAGGLAHDLGNILTPLSWAAQSLESNLPSGGTAEQDLNIIQAGNAQALELLQDLQAIGSRVSPAIENFAPEDAVKSWLDSGPDCLGDYPGDFRVELASQPNPARGNATVLVRALRKLVGRAIANAGPQGRVFLRTGVREEFWDMQVYCDGDLVPADHLDQVFEPFGWGREKGEIGSGLALSVVANLVRGMGGACDYTVVEGGNLFSILLPLAEESAS